jgi:hypothetical protein
MKLTDRSFATGVTTNDLIHIVITGDTTQSPQGSSFKASVGQIISLLYDMFEPGTGVGSLKDKRAVESSGDVGQAIGDGAFNLGNSGQAIGRISYNDAPRGQAIGHVSINSGDSGQSIGDNCTNSGIGGQAIGQQANNRIQSSTNIAGPIFIRKSDSSTINSAPPSTILKPYQLLSGAEIIIMSNVFDFTTLTGETISFPANVKMFVDEVGFISTSANTVSVQPEISYGVSGNTDFFLTGTSTTGITISGDRDRQTNLLSSSGVTSLSFEITSPATATTLIGRCYFKGFIVENQ